MTALIREYATPNVKFTGFLPPESVLDWIAARMCLRFHR
jgi:hypothetical protein